MSDNISIRGSQTAGWHDCPRRGAAKSYKDMIKDAGYEMNEEAYMVRFIASTLGTSVHAGVADALRGKIDGMLIDIEYMTKIALDDFDEAVNNGLAFDTITGSPSAGKKQIKMIIKSYYNLLLPKINPIAVEEYLEAELQDGTLITAHPDVIEQSTIRDTKTGKDPLSYHAQLGIYSMLARINEICDPKVLIVDWLPRISVAKPYVEPQSFLFNVEICEAEAKNTIKSIVSQVNEFKKKGDSSAFPANTMSNLCSQKYCPAFGTDFCKLKESEK